MSSFSSKRSLEHSTMVKLVCLFLVVLAVKGNAQEPMDAITNAIDNVLKYLPKFEEEGEAAAAAFINYLQEIAEMYRSTNSSVEDNLWESFRYTHNLLVRLQVILEGGSSPPNCTDEQRAQVNNSINATVTEVTSCAGDVMPTLENLEQHIAPIISALEEDLPKILASVGRCNGDMMPCIMQIGMDEAPVLMDQITNIMKVSEDLQTIGSQLSKIISCLLSALENLRSLTIKCIL